MSNDSVSKTRGLPENSSLSGLMGAHIANAVSTMYTSIPAIVLRGYDGGNKQMVDVQPSVSRVLRTGETEALPPIGGVPVIFPASLTSQFSFPINIGDTVLLVFCQSDIENFKLGDGRPLSAKTQRKQSIQDAVAIPGLFPFNKARNNPVLRNLPHNTHDAVLVHNIGTPGECEVRLAESGNIKLTSPFTVEIACKDAKFTASNSITMTAATMSISVPSTSWSGAITQTGDYTQTGNYSQTGTYTLAGKVINDHIHSGVSSGPSNTGPNV